MNIQCTCVCTCVRDILERERESLYWFGQDAGGGVAQCVDDVLFDEGQGSGQVLLESSQVQLRFLVVRLEGGGEKEGGGGKEGGS